jgi:gentisate 1,2-dioxygenase
MTNTLAPADVSTYYQRLAELSTVPFWLVPDITEPAGPERGHVWHWRDIYPELARSREIVDDTAALQRRALCLRNPGLTPQPSAPPTPSPPPTRCSSPAKPRPSTPTPCPPCGSAWTVAERA